MPLTTAEEALMLACVNGNVNEVERLLNDDVNVNVVDMMERTPLYQAICYSNTAVAVELLKAGAEIPAGPYNGTIYTSDRYQTLCDAVKDCIVEQTEWGKASVYAFLSCNGA